MSRTCSIYRLKRPTERFGILASEINTGLQFLLFLVVFFFFSLSSELFTTISHVFWTWKQLREKIVGEKIKEDHSVVRALPAFCVGRVWVADICHTILVLLALQWEDETSWLSTDWCKYTPEVNFSESSMGICKAGLLLHVLLHASKDTHLWGWQSDKHLPNEGDESDNLKLKSETPLVLQQWNVKYKQRRIHGVKTTHLWCDLLTESILKWKEGP